MMARIKEATFPNLGRNFLGLKIPPPFGTLENYVFFPGLEATPN